MAGNSKSSAFAKASADLRENQNAKTEGKIFKNLMKLVSRIAGVSAKNQETREVLIMEGREMENSAINNGLNINEKAASFEAADSSSNVMREPDLSSVDIVSESQNDVNSCISSGGDEGICTPRAWNDKSSSALSHPHQIILYQEKENSEKQTQEIQDKNQVIDKINIGESKLAEACPYCNSKDFVKRGTRKNKHQIVQLYICKNPECEKTFTAQDVKGRHFPLNVIIEAMSYYNLGLTLEGACAIIKQKFGVRPEAATLSSWIEKYKELCKFSRMREYAVKMFSPQNIVEVVTMAHRQLYRFRYHRAKTKLMLEEEYRNRRLEPLKDYLDNVSSVTPHQYFQEGERMSEIRSKFSKADMIVKGKFNYANRLAAFVLQAVKDNKQRHEQLQRFMLANDSVTVATEVPVYIRKEDIEHLENDLGFQILEHASETQNPKSEARNPKQTRNHKILNSETGAETGFLTIKGRKTIGLPKLLTGHIDLVQIRNGQVHLLDYKPGAAREKPVEQLTWYALAMARLTGLRMYDFTCAWFDEKDFYQFYPLHVVKKLTSKVRKKRKVYFKDGTWGEVPRRDEMVIVKREQDEGEELKGTGRKPSTDRQSRQRGGKNELVVVQNNGPGMDSG